MKAPRSLSAAVTALVVSLSVFVPVTAHAAGPTVSGAGSTWSQVALSQWIGDVSSKGLSLNYQGNGSTAGRQLYIQRQVDFAVSEIPFEESEKADLGSTTFQYLPIVAGGTSLMYHVIGTDGKRIENLQLTGETLAKIFTRQIKDWDHADIKASNPGVPLPAKSIGVVVRSDGSGTSAQFSAYLINQFSSIVGGYFGGAPRTSIWPSGAGEIAQSKSDGVSNFVAKNSETITYVEAAYAELNKFPVAKIKNAAGKFQPPNSANVSKALELASFNADRSQNLDNVYTNPAPETYPISSYSYMITPTAEKDLPAAKAEILGKFMIYFACEGQKSADRLGYSPLPPNLVQGVFDAVRALPGDLEPPPLTKENCPNPRVTASGGPAVTTTTAPAAGGTTTTTAPGQTGGGNSNNEGTDPGSGDQTSSGGTNTGDDTGSEQAGSDDQTAGGATGSTGTGRATGATGTRRATGPTGVRRATGSTGVRRATGSTGARRATGSTGAAGSTGATAEGSVVEDDSTFTEGSISGDVGSEILGRLVELEDRVLALEDRAYGVAEEGELDPELREELLAQSNRVDTGSKFWSPFALTLLALLVFGPFLRGAFSSSAKRFRRRSPRA